MGRTPVLLLDARERLSVAAASLGARCAALGAEAEALAASIADPRLDFRAQVLERRRAGLALNRALAHAELDEVLDAVVRSGGAVAASHPLERGGEDLTSALNADWGGGAEAESEVREVCGWAGSLIDQTVRPGGKALFLGAGTGRHVVELAGRFGESWAVDLSVDRTWLFERVLRQPLAFAAFEDGAPMSRDGLTRLARTEPPASSAHLHLAVADARCLPLADAGATHVVSIYFTDMVPLHQLLPEAWRVLVPGGTFMHVGPLDYAFPDPAWRLAPEELPEAFRRFGFEIDSLRAQPMEFRRSSQSGIQVIYRGLVFRARKTELPAG